MSVVSKDNQNDVPNGFRNIKISAARKALYKFGNILNTKDDFCVIDKLQKNIHVTIIRKMKTKFFCEDDICYEIIYNAKTENFDNLLELTNWFVEKNQSISSNSVAHKKFYMNNKIMITMCIALCFFIVNIFI